MSALFTRMAKLAGALPKGDRNGLAEHDALAKLTEGYPREEKHVAVVELVVREQSTNLEKGVLTNTLAIERIELIDGPNADQATSILRDAFKARKPDALPGMGADDMGSEDVGGRGDE